ncbi:MAG: hypothetical protein U0X20_11950 [Caldilineaceae bacterium]
MSSPLVRLQARIAGSLARERMGERFAAQVNYEATPVAGLGLARVDGQLVDSTVGEETSAGDLVAMANIGRPAAAIYSPQGGAAVVMAAAATSEAGGGVTVHGQLSGLTADDHQHYLNIERGDARYYTEPEVDAWRAAHIANPDIHHNHATAGAPISIDAGQYISLLYNSTLLKDGANKLGVNPAYNFAWTNSHNWAMDTALSSAGVVIPPGIAPGYGWSLVNPVSGDATLTIPNIWVGNLHAQTFIADVARADIGEEVWTRSRAVLADDLQLPKINDTIDMVVEVPPGIDPATFDLFGANHYVRLRIFDSTQGLTIADAWGTVTRKAALDKAAVKAERPSTEKPQGVAGAPAQQGYSFKLLKSDSAADPLAVPPKEGAQIMAGALVMGYGLPGDSFVLVTVIKDGAPYTAYYRWGLNSDGTVRGTAKPWEGQYWKLLTRIGNLEGQVDTAFGGALHGAGLYSENVYLKGRIQIAAGSDVPWSAVSGSGRPQDNATYGATWDQVSGAGKPQDYATYGATWGVNLTPPGYLVAPGGGSAPGLYLEGTRLGFWSGGVWRTYLDNGGNFIFTGPGVEQTSIAEGTTRLAYLATEGVLGGQVYRSGLWRRTWWTDNDSGAMFAGPSGEVMLHEHGLSMTAYTLAEIAPSYNTKSVGFFASREQAITNNSLARARIWGGYNMNATAVGADGDVKSMLQMEIGIDGDGVIASNNRPCLQMEYIPVSSIFGLAKQFRLGGFNLVHFDMVSDGGFPSMFIVGAGQTFLQNNTVVDRLLPGSGANTVGSAQSKFEAVYAKTVYADTVIAPSFTGQNTVGTELRISGYSMDASTYHTWGTNMPWTAVINDGFYNASLPKRLTADTTGFYRISYSVLYSAYEHFNFVRVYAAGGGSYYDTLHSQTTNMAATAAGDLWLTAGQYIELWCTPGNGFTSGHSARFSLVRTGTNGLPTTSSVWTAADAVFVRSNSANTTQLRIENSNAGAVMNLSVEGQITSELGLYNGVNLALLSQEWTAHKSAADPHPQYMLKAQVQQVYATQDALTAAMANGIGGGGGGETYHNALTGLTDGDPHTQYVAMAFDRVITAQHTFNPLSGRPAFVLGPNAAGRLVTGLNADLLDGHNWDELVMTPSSVLAALLEVDGAGSLLDADLVDGVHASDFARRTIIVGAGAGLIGGGALATDFSLAVGAGAGIEVGDDTVSLASSVAGEGLLFDTGVLSLNPALAGEGLLYNTGVLSFNPAVAGAGLAYNVGVLAIGQGFGITVSADAIAVDVTAGYTWTGPHIFQSTMTARHIAPEATDSYDLGTSVYWWRQQYVSQINAAVFAVQTVNLYDGWLMVPKDAGKLPVVAHGQQQIDFGKPMTPGDFLVIRNRRGDGTTAVEYMQIGTLVSSTTYNVTRDKASTGATYNWPADTSYALLGQAGDGRVEINSYDTPRISVITQGVAYNVQTETVRIGDINGMPGVTQQKWGVYIGTASQYLKWDGTSLTIAGDGSGVTNINGGNIQTGTITGAQISLSSYLAIGPANTWGSDGIQLQYNSGNPRAYIGDGANRYFKFDGATITWKAANAELDANGNLIATNATLSGAITATSGSISGTLTIGAGGKIAAGNVTLNNTGISGLAGVGGLDTSSSWRFLNSGGVQVGILSATVPYSGSDGTTVTLESYAPSPATSTTLTLSARIAGATNYINIYPNKILFVTDTLNVYTASGEKAVWHSGNLSISSFLRSDTGTQFYGGQLTVRVPDSQGGGFAGGINTLQIFQGVGGYDAMMTFHISGDYAVHFGLDGNTNDLFVGGWSMGSGYKYRIFHAGNLGKSGDWWGHVAYVGADGVTEIGKYLDFHETDADTADNSVRLTGTAGNLACNGGVSAASFYTTGTASVGALEIYSASHYVGAFNAVGAPGNAYGYINLNYNGTRRGYLLWSAGGVALTCDTGYPLQFSSGVNANTSIWSQTGTRFSTASGYVDIGPQNTSYCHFQTDRGNFYFDHSLVVNGNIGSYAADMYISRAGANRLALFSWGTYCYGHFTMEDVFALVNFQGSQPLTPATGVKIYAYNSGGNLQLRVRFSNGVDRALQLASS